MFKKDGRIISDKFELANFIQNFDAYNSELLEKLNNPELNRDLYEIKVYQYRPDLIAKEYYGSDKYLGLILVQNGIGLENYKKGNVISLIKKTDLDWVINNI